MQRTEIDFRLNGQDYNCVVEPTTSLLAFIREELGFTGTKCGCENGECGACTIIINGEPVRSCLVLAAEIDGTEVITIEGLASAEALHPLQQAFIDESAVQCGYCIPGVLLACKALLDRIPNPTEEQIVEALGGHLCRCGGYKAMSNAVRKAAEVLNNAKALNTAKAQSVK